MSQGRHSDDFRVNESEAHTPSFSVHTEILRNEGRKALGKERRKSAEDLEKRKDEELLQVIFSKEYMLS